MDTGARMDTGVRMVWACGLVVGGRVRRRFGAGAVGALPQVLLSAVIAGGTLSGDGVGIRPGLGVLTAAVVLFWSLVACGVVARFKRARPVAFAAMWGAGAGFVLAVAVSLAT
jgi:hypothetical protein